MTFANIDKLFNIITS